MESADVVFFDEVDQLDEHGQRLLREFAETAPGTTLGATNRPECVDRGAFELRVGVRASPEDKVAQVEHFLGKQLSPEGAKALAARLQAHSPADVDQVLRNFRAEDAASESGETGLIRAELLALAP